MQWIDWLIVAGFLAALAASAWSMRRHAGSVSGFLSANRLAGRYLLTVSYNMAQVGVITLVWYFQLGYDVGSITSLALVRAARLAARLVLPRRQCSA